MDEKNDQPIAIQGTELQLKHVKEDHYNSIQRQKAIKKLEQSFVKVHTPRRDDFLRGVSVPVKREMREMGTDLPLIVNKGDS